VVRDDSQFDGLQLVGTHKVKVRVASPRPPLFAVGGLGTPVRSEIGPEIGSYYQSLAEFFAGCLRMSSIIAVTVPASHPAREETPRVIVASNADAIKE
jgi:hypothetical protein